MQIGRKQGKKYVYFLILEKHNFSNKLITQIEVDGNLIKEQKEILNAEISFFDSLYAKVDVENGILNNNCDLFTKNNKIPKLSDKEKEACDTDILEAEILASLKLLQNEKSPGSDGLTTEFYKCFWHDIKLSLVESKRYCIIKGELSVEQK